MINNKGLSTVVTTLIIILLVLVAIGIVWVVIINVIEEGTADIETSTKCLSVDLKANAVACNVSETWNCTVSLYKKSGDDIISGVKLVFDNGVDRSPTPIDVPGDIATLGTKKANVNATIDNSTSVDVTVYFNDASGNAQLCKESNTYNF